MYNTGPVLELHSRWYSFSVFYVSLMSAWARCSLVLGNKIKWSSSGTSFMPPPSHPPIIFNIFTNIVSLFITNSCFVKYANDNTLYAITETTIKWRWNLVKILKALKVGSNNRTVLNPKKSVYTCLGSKRTSVSFNIMALFL